MTLRTKHDALADGLQMHLCDSETVSCCKMTPSGE